MNSRRDGESDVLNKLIETKEPEQAIEKIASSTNHPAIRVDATAKLEIMTLHAARIARRKGEFVKVAGRQDLYQDVKTNEFWKISDDHVVRAFDENNGIAIEK